jgi:hypothetical protein
MKEQKELKMAPKKKPIYSEMEVPKKKKPVKRRITLADGSVIETNDNRKPSILKGKSYKHIIPEKKFSTESGKKDSDWEITDNYDSLEYPPPSRHPLFRKFWAENLKDITSRESFKNSHLSLLEVMCRLMVEVKNLDDFILENGYTYRTVTVMGEQRKNFPEVAERNKAIMALARYMDMLNLSPRKSAAKGKFAADNNKEDSWE